MSRILTNISVLVTLCSSFLAAFGSLVPFSHANSCEFVLAYATIDDRVPTITGDYLDDC